MTKTYTVFTTKTIPESTLKKYRSSYPTFSYKRGDITFVVVCHGEGVVLCTKG